MHGHDWTVAFRGPLRGHLRVTVIRLYLQLLLNPICASAARPSRP